MSSKDLPKIDSSDSARFVVQNNRDWIVFVLACVALGFAGSTVFLGVMVVRKYSPKVVTVEKKVEVSVEKIVVVPRDEKIEPTEKSLLARLEMLSPPIKLEFLGSTDDGARLFQVADLPLSFGFKTDADGRFSEICIQGELARFADFGVDGVLDGMFNEYLFRLRRILETIAFVCPGKMTASVSKTVGMFELEAKGKPSTRMAYFGRFDAFVKHSYKSTPPIVEIMLRLAK